MAWHKVLCVMMGVWIGVLCYPVSANAADVSAASYMLMDASFGTVLAEGNAYERRPMASTTKIMTTLIALEYDLDTPFVADEQALMVEGSSMGLLGGDEVTLRDLCYGMMLSSGNDAANLTAVHIAGSVEAFAKLMNKKAEEIGMKDTNFANPSGLPDDNHYSTAYDMALLAKTALQNELFAEICSTDQIKLTFGNPPAARWLENHNKLLALYDGCIGMKTGFTKAAGRCLVSAAERDGRTLVCVTLNAGDDWNDHMKLFDEGFARETNTLWSAEETVTLSVTGGEQTSIVAKTDKDVVSYTEGDAKVLVDPFYYAPVTKGDVVGTVVVTTESGQERLSLIATESVAAKTVVPEKQGFLEILQKVFGEVSFEDK